MKPIPKNHCQFYIVRHGETVWNREGRMQGQKDSDLTDSAIEQARTLGKKLKRINFAATYSSDLGRAKKTAELIKLEKQAAITATALLRERSLGVFEGQKYEDLSDELRELLYKLDNRDYSNKMKKNNIETVDQALSRILHFLRQTALAYPNQRVLLVSHAGIMGHFLVKLGHLGVDHFTQLKINNLSYIILNSDGADLEVIGTSGITLRNEEAA